MGMEPQTDTLEERRCKRPTKSGSPCRNMGNGLVPGMPCHTHQTDEDVRIHRMLHKAFSAGFKSGDESGRQSLKWELEREKREEERKLNWRVRTNSGQQIVTVGGKYSYIWSGQGTLEVGDEVLLPANWFNKSVWASTVTELGSDYSGDMASIIRRVDKSN